MHVAPRDPGGPEQGPQLRQPPGGAPWPDSAQIPAVSSRQAWCGNCSMARSYLMCTELLQCGCSSTCPAMCNQADIWPAGRSSAKADLPLALSSLGSSQCCILDGLQGPSPAGSCTNGQWPVLRSPGCRQCRRSCRPWCCRWRLKLRGRWRAPSPSSRARRAWVTGCSLQRRPLSCQGASACRGAWPACQAPAERACSVCEKGSGVSQRVAGGVL